MMGSTTRMVLLGWCVLLAAGCANQTPLATLQERGDTAYTQGDYSTAYDNYHQYVSRSPSDPVVLHSLGRTLIDMGRPNEAISYLRQAYDLLPHVDLYVDTLAEAYFQTDDRDSLYQFLRSVKDNRQDDRRRVNDLIRLGTFAARLHDVDEAEVAFLQAAELDAGRTIEPQLALADFYSSIGDRENAIERLRMALWFNIRNEEVNLKLRQLGEVPGPSLALQPKELKFVLVPIIGKE